MTSWSEFEALLADLAYVEALLQQRPEDVDPVGWLQFNQRKAELESKIAEFQRAADHPPAAEK